MGANKPRRDDIIGGLLITDAQSTPYYSLHRNPFYDHQKSSIYAHNINSCFAEQTATKKNLKNKIKKYKNQSTLKVFRNNQHSRLKKQYINTKILQSFNCSLNSSAQQVDLGPVQFPPVNEKKCKRRKVQRNLANLNY